MYDPAVERMRAQADVGGGNVAEQAAALQSVPTDAGTGAAAAPTDAPKAPSTDWKEEVSKLGVDPGWVVRLRMKLVESGKVSMDDIQADKLADPEHRKWLNKMLKDATGAEATPATGGAEPAPAGPQTGGAEPAPTAAPKPSVLRPGHLPTGPIWHSTPVPAGDGWTPAGDGLWWPPYPVTGGPIAKPAVQSATAQASALDTSTGQARPESTGG